MKTYKREIAGVVLGFDLCLFLISATIYKVSPDEAVFILDIAKFLYPGTMALVAAAFGIDWYSKQGPGAKP